MPKWRLFFRSSPPGVAVPSVSDLAKAPMESAGRPRYERVVIICPEAITGGPEALHQLGDSINRQGGHAVMAYRMGKNALRFDGDRLLCTPRPGEAFRAHYAPYSPITEEAIPLGDRTLVVYPEMYPLEALRYRQGPRAIWWLSVDNALQYTPSLAYRSSARELFRDDSLLHFHQSCYARSYLLEQGARQVVPLYDYVERGYQLSPTAAAAKAAANVARSVALFPRKGAELAQVFVDGAPNVTYRRIDGMTRAQVGEALAGTSVYIDFGHQPGKDRVPREAALAGNVVFLHEKGAGAHFGDYPVDRQYLFTPDDVHSGALRARVHEALREYPTHLARQAPLRQQIALERQEFDLQVSAAFFTPA